MQFKIINGEGSLRKHDIETLKQVIYDLKDNEDSFIILEPKHPIENSIYLQAVKQLDVYIAEIRFVFGRNENYKHYSKVFDTVEALFEVFRAYYSEEKVPDVKGWKDESNLEQDEIPDMVKLYKKENGVTRYFEVWLNDEISLTTHQGILGDTGETEDVIYDEEGDLPVDMAMAEIISKQKQLGYKEIEELTELIIQYPKDESINKKVLSKKKTDLEALLNECLGWTGNGHCDGGDISSDALNLFCYVVDKDIAARSILEMLVEESCLDGVRIGYADEFSGEYKLLYPNIGSFTLL